MKIFLAGATGVIGIRLVPLLVAAGHQVTAMTRTPAMVDPLADLGTTPVVCDVYDLDGLRRAVVAAAPDLLLHELTDLPDDVAALPASRAANSRMRREGTANLLAAARAVGSPPRILAQSVAWALQGEGEAAKQALETSVLALGGVVLRYGQFYGPGTFYETAPPPPPRVHVDEAARRTVALLDAPSGIVTITD